MACIVKFWYCYEHDDGAMSLHREEEYNEFNKDSNTPPDWLDICKSNKCNYECHGIIEIDYKGDIIVHRGIPPNSYYNKFASNFRNSYYMTIYDNKEDFYLPDEISSQLDNYISEMDNRDE